MCPDHWRMVPRKQQSAVNKAFRALFDRRATLADSRELIEKHTEEKQAAIRMVVAALTPVEAA
jgi:acyl-[acyl carrier protein]--UDP-N-acetylglucosamine O-acyltransferase